MSASNLSARFLIEFHSAAISRKPKASTPWHLVFSRPRRYPLPSAYMSPRLNCSFASPCMAALRNRTASRSSASLAVSPVTPLPSSTRLSPELSRLAGAGAREVSDSALLAPRLLTPRGCAAGDPDTGCAPFCSEPRGDKSCAKSATPVATTTMPAYHPTLATALGLSTDRR